MRTLASHISSPPRLFLFILFVFIVPIVFGATGCFLFSSDPPPVAPIEAKTYEPLPQDDGKLYDLANVKNVPDASMKDLQTAISAYEDLVEMISDGRSSLLLVDVRWRLAKALFFASEKATDTQEKLRWIVKGEGVAANVVTERPDRVEGYYYLALLKGRRAQLSRIGFGAMKLAEKVLALGEKASAIDPAFDDGGPLRLLAMLYAKAPPWPTSVGDMDLALESAKRALQISDYPMNHLIYAEVLIEDDELDSARKELETVLSAPKEGKWASEGEQWRPYAMQLLGKIGNK